MLSYPVNEFGSESYLQECAALTKDIVEHVGKFALAHTKVASHLKNTLMVDALCNSITQLVAIMFHEEHGESLICLCNGDHGDSQAQFAKMIVDFLKETVAENERATYALSYKHLLEEDLQQLVSRNQKTRFPVMVAALVDALFSVFTEMFAPTKQK